jgi:hypothetical protein
MQVREHGWESVTKTKTRVTDDETADGVVSIGYRNQSEEAACDSSSATNKLPIETTTNHMKRNHWTITLRKNVP